MNTILKHRPVRLLTVKQVAARLGLKERTIRRWIMARKITYVKLGHWVRIPQHAVRDMVKGRIVPKIEGTNDARWRT